MDWYSAVTAAGRRVNPVSMDWMREAHKIARDHQDTVPYTTTIEAIFTALNHSRLDHALCDWRVWSILDAVGFGPERIEHALREAKQAFLLGGLMPTMLTPEIVSKVIPEGMRVSFIKPTAATERTYTTAEKVASFTGKFQGSVVSSWVGIGADDPSRYGKVLTVDDMVFQHERQKKKKKDRGNLEAHHLVPVRRPEH
jgi:hypothetical protein